MSEWIKCSERMPDVKQRVIGWLSLPDRDSGFSLMVTREDDAPTWHYDVDYSDEYPAVVQEWRVTHWMPLPEPP